MARRKKAGKVTVTYADGTVEVKRPGEFRPPPRTRRQRMAKLRRSPHWRKIRRQALERDGHCCVRCGSREHLEVHHLTYVRLGAERLEDVLTLCQRCHAAEHAWQRRLRREVA